MKHKLPRFLTFLLLLFAAHLPLLASTEVKIDGINYTLDESTNTASVGDNSSFVGDCVIPSHIVYNGLSYRVTSIGVSAFDGCINMTSVVIPNSVTTIESYAFMRCSGFTSVVIPNFVTHIGRSAFEGCINLTSVVIPNSVTTIGDSAFEGCCNLTSVTIGNSVTNIGCSAFEGCMDLASVVIPNSVTTIGDRAFNRCWTLTSVTIGNSVASIGKGAFMECSGLTSVEIPNSVTTIGERAFRHCSDLASVTIGNSVTVIGEDAFLTDRPSYYSTDFYCLSINPPKIESQTLPFSTGILWVPTGCVEKYKNADVWKDFYKIVEEEPVVVNASVNIRNAGVIYGAQEYLHGQIINLRAIARPNYTFEGWYEDDKLQSKSELYTFTAENDRNLVAVFKPRPGESPVTVTTTGGNTTLTWPGVESASTYIASVYSDAEMTTPVATKIINAPAESAGRRNAPADMSVTFEDLSGGVEYYYSITAVNADGETLSRYDGSFTTGITGVEDVVIETFEVIGYYNLQGVRSDEPWPGLNIVVYSDGSTRKMVYK